MSGTEHLPTAGPPSGHMVPMTSFVGRVDEIQRVAGMLLEADTRLLTLIGPGGIGKTRLALQVVERVRARFRDGVAFVSLVALRDPSLVPQTMAQGMNLSGGPASPQCRS